MIKGYCLAFTPCFEVSTSITTSAPKKYVVIIIDHETNCRK
jgi:hypothetical protein